MTARAVMVPGCTSHAGKSGITTALCRWCARRGPVVRPCKAQHMRNHARVMQLAAGMAGEVGSARHCQALAARARPGLFENPAVVQALFGRAPPPLDAVFDRLAATIDPHFSPGALLALRKP